MSDIRLPHPEQDALDAAIARVRLVEQDPFAASIKVMENEALMKGAYATMKALMVCVGMDALAGSEDRSWEVRIPPEILRDPAPDLELVTTAAPDGALILRLQPRRP